MESFFIYIDECYLTLYLTAHREVMKSRTPTRNCFSVGVNIHLSMPTTKSKSTTPTF